MINEYYQETSKLAFKWMAGVPMIGGGDSAFTADGREGIDYIRCDTIESLLKALARLKDNSVFRQRMVAEGKRAAQQFTPESITERWKKLLYSSSIVRAPSYLKRHRALRTINHWVQHMNLLGDSLRGY